MSDKDGFCSFLNLLVSDYENNHEFWQNQDLQSFLTALRDYAAGDGGYMDEITIDNKEPSWANFAEMLAAARAFG